MTNLSSLLRYAQNDSLTRVRPDRVAVQGSYVAEIWQNFDYARAVVPLFNDEVRGSDALKKVATNSFSLPSV